MRYVVLGSSAAGINAVRELHRLDESADIILISQDEAIYSRCILHQYLGGRRDLERLCFAEKNFADLYRVDWKKGRTCVGLDRAAKEVVLDGGQRVAYDKLLVATGSHTFIPPVENLKEAKNVIGFRNIGDIEVLKEVAKTAKHIVVMGAGLVGLDCASGFLELGVKVTLVEMAGWLLTKQLDQQAARTYQEAFEAEGVAQYYGVGISKAVLDENGMIVKVILTDGRTLPCDYVVVTAGVRANVEFLQDSGIELSRFGLVYDASGQTSDPDVYGAGDVSGTSPIWPAAVKQGIIAASNMAGVERKQTDFFASKSTMNFLGIPSMSLGEVNGNGPELSVEIREDKHAYKKIVHKHGKIVGAILQGDLAYGGILQQLIAHKIDVSKVKKPVFDIDYSDFFHMSDNFEFYYDE